MENKNKIWFDLDNTLWDINTGTFRLAGVKNPEMNDYYNYLKITNFSDTEKARIMEIAGSVEVVDNAVWYPHVEDIYELEKMSPDIEVWIQTACLSEEAKQRKIERLQEIKGINMEHVRFTTSSDYKQPRMSGFISVDDYVKNLIDYPSTHNILMGNELYNQKIMMDRTVSEYLEYFHIVSARSLEIALLICKQIIGYSNQAKEAMKKYY